MRVMTEQVHQGSRRWGVWALGFLAGLVALVLLAEGLSAVWTDFLWFHWTGLGEVWSSVASTKAALAAVFIVAAFALSWVSLLLVDKISPRAALLGPETELVRRYHAAIGPHATLVRTVVSVLLGLALGAGTAGQWQHWMLFEHAVPFGRSDPLFHLDDSFFVFRLPFLSFLVGWILVALLVVFIVSVVAHFLNGAIRLQGHPRVEPRAIAHLSLLLGVMALVRAWGYYYVDRYRLDMSGNGVVGGAGYSDVHVRLPADTLLAVVALAGFVLLVVNAYQRSLTLPLIAVGLWAALALVVGVIYPAAVQAFSVNPAQSSLERPYIQHNIRATRYAMGLDHVTSRRFPANTDLTPGVLAQYRASLDASQVWDPTFTKATFGNLRQVSPFFSLTPLQVDRYRIGGRLTPVDVSVRRLAPGGAGQPSWVNLHLQYTHGTGVVAAPATVARADGEPAFASSRLPPTTSGGLPPLRQPRVYFAPGDAGYVVADTTQPEVDYHADTKTVTSHYHGGGGVPLSSWFTRAAYALRLKDFNLLISNDITGHSRLMYVTSIRARVQKALPFLTVDNEPYAVIDHGHLDWVVDAYTTSNSFPYGQPALSGSLPAHSPLGGSYDYVRDAAKVVVNAYTGKMHVYAIDPGADPILRSYMRAFPGLFQPLSSMDATLRAHLRYPQELLTVQAAMYGRYHVTQASQLYDNSDAWDLAQTSTSANGSPIGRARFGTGGGVARYQPIYELLQLPGAKRPSFEAVEPLVPYSPGGGELKTLSAVLFAGSDPKHYGQLESLVTGRPGVAGPSLANADILHSQVVSDKINALDQSGAEVVLGTLQVVPVADSLLYVRPMYVSGGRNEDFPLLVDVIVLYGKDIAVEPTLSGALKDVFGTAAGVRGPGLRGATPTPPPTTPKVATMSPRVRRLLEAAAASYQAAQKALNHRHLGTYQADMTAVGKDLRKAQALLSPKHHKRSRAVKKGAKSTSRSSASSSSGSSASGSSTTSADRSATSVRRAVASAKTGKTSATGPAGAGTSASHRAPLRSRVPKLSPANGHKVGAVEAPVAAVEGLPTGTPGTTGGGSASASHPSTASAAATVTTG